MALLGTAFAVSVFWPGMLSNDAAFMWWQARGGRLDTIHSPAFVYLWRILVHVADSPGPVFVFNLVLFWTGLALICRELGGSLGWRAPCVLAVGIAPPVWVVMAQAGTDASLLATLVLATGSILCFQRSRLRVWQLVALAALTWAAAMRHNALPALLPLVWLCWPLRTMTGMRRFAARAGASALSLLLIAAIVILVGRTAPEQRAVWPATAMWDLAALSVAEQRVLLPADTVGPGMTPEDLASAYVPWTNTLLFSNTRAGVLQPFLKPAQSRLKREILVAWWQAVLRYPKAYAQHRWRLTKALFGTHSKHWPRELIYFPHPAQFDHNPPVSAQRNAWQGFWYRRLDAWRTSPILAAWPWLLLAVPALVLAIRQRRAVHARMAMLLVASGALVALPLLVVSPAAELRYLAWPIAASLLALLLAISGRIRSAG